MELIGKRRTWLPATNESLQHFHLSRRAPPAVQHDAALGRLEHARRAPEQTWAGGGMAPGAAAPPMDAHRQLAAMTKTMEAFQAVLSGGDAPQGLEDAPQGLEASYSTLRLVMEERAALNKEVDEAASPPGMRPAATNSNAKNKAMLRKPSTA